MYTATLDIAKIVHIYQMHDLFFLFHAEYQYSD